MSTEPMLASPSSTIAPTASEAVGALARTGLWMFELKMDGVRCLASVTDGVVSLRSRQGIDMTPRYPEIAAAIREYFPHDIELDGELVIYKNGRPSFSAIHRRDALQSPLAIARAELATFVIFDIPSHTGPYTWRRQTLERWSDALTGNARLTINASYEDGVTAWTFVGDHQLEGLVAKKRSSAYRPGRSRDWIKLKPTRRLSALVSGVVPGENGRAGDIGALRLSLLDEADQLVPIGKVGSGFSRADLSDIAKRVTKGPLIVDIDYMEVSPAGQLRHPVFKGVRTDLSVLDCRNEQLKH